MFRAFPRLAPRTALSLAALSLAACGEAPVTVTEPDALVARGVVSSNVTPAVVMSGLDNPRGLAWGPEGGLYVAEAGNPSHGALCAPVARGENCFSGTGAVTRLWRGTQERVASGLPSAFNPATGDVVGPHDVGMQGRGSMRVTIGWGADPAARAGLGALGRTFGALLQVQPSGGWQVVADVSAFERSNNPIGATYDSNPYGLLVEPGATYVTDAGANALLRVSANETVSLVAAFPTHLIPPPFLTSEAVPTAVERGPDGALYVSTLTGVPFADGLAGIYRVVPGQAPQLYAGGFKTITDFTFAPNGDMYVVQYATGPVFFSGPGKLIRVAANGVRTTIADMLESPTGVIVGPDGAVYVSNRGDKAAVGQVLKFMP